MFPNLSMFRVISKEDMMKLPATIGDICIIEEEKKVQSDDSSIDSELLVEKNVYVFTEMGWVDYGN